MRFNGNWNCGYDVALIAIPEMAPSANASGLCFDVYDMDNFPDSVSVNGFPIMRDKKVFLSEFVLVLQYVFY